MIRQVQTLSFLSLTVFFTWLILKWEAIKSRCALQELNYDEPMEFQRLTSFSRVDSIRQVLSKDLVACQREQV